MNQEKSQEFALVEIEHHLFKWQIEPAFEILSSIIKFEIGNHNSQFNKIKAFAAQNGIKDISKASKKYTEALEGLTIGIQKVLRLEKNNPKLADEYRKKTLLFAAASKNAFNDLLNLTHKHGLTMNT